MDKTQEALKLALEALEKIGLRGWVERKEDAITAIREALAEQPAQQPVSVTDELVEAYCWAWAQSFVTNNPYHTVKMTTEDRKHIAAGLRAALAEQPAQQQEPVAWITKNGKGWLRWHKPEDSEKNKDSIPLYTSPPASKPWVGLTDEEIHKMTVLMGINPEWKAEMEIVRSVVRNLEAKLREKNA